MIMRPDIDDAIGILINDGNDDIDVTTDQDGIDDNEDIDDLIKILMIMRPDIFMMRSRY